MVQLSPKPAAPITPQTAEEQAEFRALLKQLDPANLDLVHKVLHWHGEQTSPALSTTRQPGRQRFQTVRRPDSFPASHAGAPMRWRRSPGKKIGHAWGIAGKAYVDRITAALRYYGLLEYQGVGEERA